MDSITQAALGASVGHLFWHKPLGRKALGLGAVFGTLPDLDILAYPFMDAVQRLYWHRGESHSIWFIMLGSYLFALFLHHYWFKNRISTKRLSWGIFAIFSTHVLIDYFTIYGTQLLAPLSRYGFAHGNLFIIDPLYTLPLLFGIFFTLFLKDTKRVKANLIGLYLSSFYALFSLGAHAYAHGKFTQALQDQGMHVQKSQTAATPFNTLLWRHLVQTPQGLKVGYYSLIAPKAIIFEDIDQNKELVEPYKDQANVKVIQWFSKGFWIAKKEGEDIRISDARFGEIRPSQDAPPQNWQYNFSWKITKEANKMYRASRGDANIKSALHILYLKLIGKI